MMAVGNRNLEFVDVIGGVRLNFPKNEFSTYKVLIYRDDQPLKFIRNVDTYTDFTQDGVYLYTVFLYTDDLRAPIAIFDGEHSVIGGGGESDTNDYVVIPTVTAQGTQYRLDWPYDDVPYGYIYNLYRDGDFVWGPLDPEAYFDSRDPNRPQPTYMIIGESTVNPRPGVLLPPPSNEIEFNFSNGSVTLDWEDEEIQDGPISESTEQELIQSGGSLIYEYTDNDVQASQTYEYRIQSVQNRPGQAAITLNDFTISYTVSGNSSGNNSGNNSGNDNGGNSGNNGGNGLGFNAASAQFSVNGSGDVVLNWGDETDSRWTNYGSTELVLYKMVDRR